MASNILNKAKPKVTPPPPKEEANKDAASADKMEADQQQQQPASPTVNGSAPPNEMDVD
jgi:hypothetical protein